MTCHVVDTLHAGAGHTYCADCHLGRPQAGNVTPAKCAVCHPLLDPPGPGSCNLVDGHDPGLGADCLACHPECAPGPTTTTTQPFVHNIDSCQECHLTTDLHAGAGHTYCTDCHVGKPQVGTTTPSKCMICHPLGDPGECNLTVLHAYNVSGTTCLGCHAHSECRITTTTTSPTTTTTAVSTTTTTVLTTTTTTEPTTTMPADSEICNDGIDNDQDGLSDCDDPDCTDALVCNNVCAGDANGDCKVDLSDLVILKNEFLRNDCDISPCRGDANEDNKVDLYDMVITKEEFMRNDCRQ